ncbi:hypothetical protein DIPPA_32704 [Diplonema papillatum]|nr:hypothetical protein DIPPA_32704 [Diplonema papillatum]
MRAAVMRGALSAGLRCNATNAFVSRRSIRLRDKTLKKTDGMKAALQTSLKAPVLENPMADTKALEDRNPELFPHKQDQVSSEARDAVLSEESAGKAKKKRSQREKSRTEESAFVRAFQEASKAAAAGKPAKSSKHPRAEKADKPAEADADKATPDSLTLQNPQHYWHLNAIQLLDELAGKYTEVAEIWKPAGAADQHALALLHWISTTEPEVAEAMATYGVGGYVQKPALEGAPAASSDGSVPAQASEAPAPAPDAPPAAKPASKTPAPAAAAAASAAKSPAAPAAAEPTAETPAPESAAEPAAGSPPSATDKAMSFAALVSGALKGVTGKSSAPKPSKPAPAAAAAPPASAPVPPPAADSLPTPPAYARNKVDLEEKIRVLEEKLKLALSQPAPLAGVPLPTALQYEVLKAEAKDYTLASEDGDESEEPVEFFGSVNRIELAGIAARPMTKLWQTGIVTELNITTTFSRSELNGGGLMTERELHKVYIHGETLANYVMRNVRQGFLVHVQGRLSAYPRWSEEEGKLVTMHAINVHPESGGSVTILRGRSRSSNAAYNDIEFHQLSEKASDQPKEDSSAR